ncbi:NFATC2-interacting protein [Chanos chanos]|uniref:NFATC2-interacting protein n=1 Tax=Chanos chanos TaxID=29144 RepID=A0A6J2WYW4_CHACN|nr:NFATC2-interacting protein [Chanos chanos]
MAEVISDSDSDGEVSVTKVPRPPPKRRRIIDPSAITTVPIYSNKVNSSLNLKPTIFKQTDDGVTDGDGASPWPSSSENNEKQLNSICLSDSEEEEVELEKQRKIIHSPSPPPPRRSPPAKRSNRANKKIREVNRKLEAIDSMTCPSPEKRDPAPERYDSSSSVALDDEDEEDDDDDDDVVVITSDNKRKRNAPCPEVNKTSREISLKFRCRTDVYRIPVLTTAPLSEAVDQLSIKLNVPPTRILLLKKEMELPVHASANQLDLGIADIIDCVVIAEGKQDESDQSDVITVRLQSKEKASSQEYSLRKDAPLGSVLSSYLSTLTASAKQRVCFLFDGSKVTHNQTPSELDMEDGDVIEVWV